MWVIFIVICSKNVAYYSGYHEQNSENPHTFQVYIAKRLLNHSHRYSRLAVLGLWVCIVALFSYFARLVADLNCQHGFIIFTNLKYFDYLISCPILVLDLLWNLESPYRWWPPHIHHPTPTIPANFT